MTEPGWGLVIAFGAAMVVCAVIWLACCVVAGRANEGEEYAE